jgi:3-deoxy-D-manno-octulosonic-acid transferase
MFKKLKERNINLILLNARFTKKTFDRWMKIKFFSKSIFENITIAFPQNNETSAFLKKINTTKVNFIGNLKFAENNDHYQNKLSDFLKIELKNKKIWVASSTHKNEEIFCAKVHIKLKKKVKNLLTIIIPRHIHRVEKIVYEINKLNLKTVCHSQNPQNFDDVDVYIVDTFGDTKTFHKIGSSVFLGGSLIKHGGQNPLEAARFGAKIFHGPNIDNFKDVYKLLKSLNISKKITSTKQLASSIFFKKNNSSGNKIKNIGEKILKKTIKEINTQFYNEFKKT